MGCESGWTYPDRRYFTGGRRRDAVSAGPITLLGLNGHADGDFSRRRALHTKVLLRPRRTTTVAVAARDRERVSLVPQIFNGGREIAAEGRPAITFEGCAPRTDDSRRGEEVGTGYAFTLMVDGPGCATFAITPARAQGAERAGRTMRRTVRFGVQDCA